MKSKYTHKSIPERIGVAHGFFEISKDNQEVLNLLAKRSFTEEKMKNGYIFYKEASNEFLIQQKMISERKKSNVIFITEFKKISKEFSTLFMYSKMMFKGNKEIYYILGLNKVRINSISEIFSELNQYFTNVYNFKSIIEKLEKYGYSKDYLDNFKERYDNAYKLYLDFKLKESNAIKKTKIRNEKMKLLDNFMCELIEVAVVIEKTVPDFIITAGIIL